MIAFAPLGAAKPSKATQVVPMPCFPVCLDAISKIAVEASSMAVLKAEVRGLNRGLRAIEAGDLRRVSVHVLADGSDRQR